ncbi:DUF1499 domain-containing protein [Methyloversatilis sp.]|uniref:DUF1499 domain-containing protein n=1 Tax=Methyloversatilis sp. TaxID=2569862 RepID=UPI0030155302
MATSLTTLPDDLPVPLDDGAAAHLEGMRLPALALPRTEGGTTDLAALRGLQVIYVYPMTGRPDAPLPDGWDAIPGARGCTPQSCAFRDHHAELAALGAGVFGLSSQTSHYQQEAAARLHLPFPLLSDDGLQLKAALRLPTFTAAGLELYRRLTLITDDARIVKVFYPVFPPDRNATDVLAWLKEHTMKTRATALALAACASTALAADAAPRVLTRCPDSPNCVSTQSDSAAKMAPIPFSGDAAAAQARLKQVILAQPRATITREEPGFIAAEFRSRIFRFVDAAEFAIDAGASVIHYRSGARTGYSDFGVNRSRMEALAKGFAEAK